MGKRRTLIKALLTLTFMLCGLTSVAQSTPTEHRWDNLIKAISAVESRGNTRAVNGVHVGILQIAPITVRECNRINELNEIDKRYAYRDRYDKKRSIEMFNIIQNHYNPSRNIEVAMRLWNGGCGYTIKETNNYVKSVYKELRKIEEASD